MYNSEIFVTAVGLKVTAIFARHDYRLECVHAIFFLAIPVSR